MKPLERVARLIYEFLPLSRNCLQRHGVQFIPGIGMNERLRGCQNLLEFYRETFLLRTFEMSLFNQIGSALEVTLFDFYRERKPSLSITQLQRNLGNGVLQRVLPGQQNGLLECFASGLGIRVDHVATLPVIQEYYAHRHLYTHRFGVIDAKYLKSLGKLSSFPSVAEHIRYVQQLTANDPSEEWYYHKPLDRLTEFMGAAKQFCSDLVELSRGLTVPPPPSSPPA